MKTLFALYLLFFMLKAGVQAWTYAPVPPGKPAGYDPTVTYWTPAPTSDEWCSARKRR